MEVIISIITLQRYGRWMRHTNNLFKTSTGLLFFSGNMTNCIVTNTFIWACCAFPSRRKRNSVLMFPLCFLVSVDMCLCFDPSLVATPFCHRWLSCWSPSVLCLVWFVWLYYIPFLFVVIVCFADLVSSISLFLVTLPVFFLRFMDYFPGSACKLSSTLN